VRGWWCIAAVAAVLFAGTAHGHPGLSRQIDALSAEIRSGPRDVQLRLRRASLYRELGHFEDARRDLRVVQRLAPDALPLLLERGLLASAQGKRARADSELTRYIDRGGSHATAFSARGRLRADSGRLQEARDDFDAALALAPSPDLYLARGRADVALGELDRAAEGYARGVEAFGGLPLTMALVEVERERGEPARALALVDGLLATTPGQPTWLTLRADLLDAQGKPKLAASDRLCALSYADARLATRATPLRRLDRAKVYLAIGLNAYALADLRQVAKEAPGLRQTQSLIDAAAGS
jgi:tetratricopeptide (TPR) repeat protein